MDIKLDNPALLLAFFVLAAVLLLVALVWLVRTEKRLRRFFLGTKAKTLEDTIVRMQDEIAVLKTAKDSAEKELAVVNQKLKKSIRGVETIRFNPFSDQGSNQSFAIGFMNEDGDGVVMSSLYSRDRMSVFAKPVRRGASEYDLTAEEAEVLEKARVK